MFLRLLLVFSVILLGYSSFIFIILDNLSLLIERKYYNLIINYRKANKASRDKIFNKLYIYF